LDDRSLGQEDARGHWAPNKPITYMPVFEWPSNPQRLAKCLFGFPGYLLPWNLIYAVLAHLHL
jgi:hypothetical protein